MRGLAGLRVIVTGARSGIGAASVERLLHEGAAVAAVDLTPPAGPGGAALELVADVTSEEQVRAVVARAAAALGGVDGVVLCAGTCWAGPTHEMPLEELDRLLAVHVRGTFLACRETLPAMVERRSGRIVTLGSTAAVRGVAMMSAYAAAKGAVLQLTRSLALEYAGSGVRANCVCPGATDTPLLRRLLDDLETHGELGREYVASIPAGRLARPDDVAGVIAFLLSDESDYVNGAALMVDGGTSAG